MAYPALLPLMRTPRLPVVDWTDAPADLNGLVRFAVKRDLVSARVPSHFKRSLTTDPRYWEISISRLLTKSFQLHALGHLCSRGDFYLFNTGHSLHEYPFFVSAPISIWANKTEGQNTLGWVVPTKRKVQSLLLHHRTIRTVNQRRKKSLRNVRGISPRHIHWINVESHLNWPVKRTALRKEAEQKSQAGSEAADTWQTHEMMCLRIYRILDRTLLSFHARTLSPFINKLDFFMFCWPCISIQSYREKSNSYNKTS